MDLTWILVLAALAVTAGALAFYYRRKTNEMNQLYEQIHETAKQIPQQKKASFILFMFRESIRAGKNKDANLLRRVNDPKQLEVQLVQMGAVLKDRSKVTDKQLKRALQTYDTYVMWEKKKASKGSKKA